jgi:hypothetical protein
LWYVEKYHPDGKHPYLKAHLEDFAALRKLVTNRRRDRIEIVAPMDARAAEIKKLRSLGAVRIRVPKDRSRIVRPSERRCAADGSYN